jgi:AcrR family transcriptional regulator
MCPQPSNRAALLEGALRCVESLPPERVTARAIAEESAANLASIAYHFGSKDALITEAVVLGLDRWLGQIADALGTAGQSEGGRSFPRAWAAVEATLAAHRGLARAFVAALARAQHDDTVRRTLAAGFAKTRVPVAELLDLGDDEPARDAGGLVVAMFYGLLLQVLLDPHLAIEQGRMTAAQARLRAALPAG